MTTDNANYFLFLLVFIVSSLLGLAVWISIFVFSGEEPWSTSVFYNVGIPLLMLISLFAGFTIPSHRRFMGLAVILLQPLGVMITNSSLPVSMEVLARIIHEPSFISSLSTKFATEINSVLFLTSDFLGFFSNLRNLFCQYKNLS